MNDSKQIKRLMADRTDTPFLFFLQVTDGNCLQPRNPGASSKIYKLEGGTPHHFRSFCSLLSAASAVLFCGSKAKACRKSVHPKDDAKYKLG
jgi:hypothetical protein